mgnify:CR=1 FL=1
MFKVVIGLQKYLFMQQKGRTMFSLYAKDKTYATTKYFANLVLFLTKQFPVK